MPEFKELDDYRIARDILINARFTEEGMAEIFGSRVLKLGPQERPGLLQKVMGDSPQEVFVRLFMLKTPVGIDIASKAFEPMSLECWQSAGIIDVQGDKVVAVVKLSPGVGFLIASDIQDDVEARPNDYVGGVSSSSAILANATIRKPVDRALDLGTGCGLHSLMTASHCNRVVATDINERALGFARFTACLNGIDTIEFKCGNLFEPVEGQQFDLITYNPPFMISPESRYIYRDSGKCGDEFVRDLLQQMPEYLTEGGYGQFVCNWTHVGDENWHDRLTGWLEGVGCDAWIIRRYTQTPPEYFAFWNAEQGTPTDSNPLYQEWMDYYRQHDIKAISFGIITLRRRKAERNFHRISDWTAKMTGTIGDDIHNGFVAQDYFDQNSSDEDMLGLCLCVAPGVEMEQRLSISQRKWQSKSLKILRKTGITSMGAIDRALADVVALCDGSQPLGEILDEVAGKYNFDLAANQKQYLATIRSLILRGFLRLDGGE